MQDRLLVAASLAEVRVVAGIENMEQPGGLKHAPGKDKEILFLLGAARQRLAPVVKVDEVPRHEMKPRRDFAMVVRVAPVAQVEQVIVALPVKRNEIRRHTFFRPIKDAHIFVQIRSPNNAL